MNIQDNITPETLAKLGNKFYNENLREKLEKESLGQYVVIEIESGDYFVNQDLKTALEQAQTKFPDKLFHIIKIGETQNYYKDSVANNYGWLF